MPDERTNGEAFDFPRQLRKPPPELPRLPPQPTAMDLARAYGTMSGAWYQYWPILIGTLERQAAKIGLMSDSHDIMRLEVKGVRASVDALTTELRKVLAKVDAEGEQMRRRLESVPDLAEEVAKEVAEKIATETGSHRLDDLKHELSLTLATRDRDSARVRVATLTKEQERWRNRLGAAAIALVVFVVERIVEGMVKGHP